MQAAEAHAQDVERSVQAQLAAALDKLSALNLEPPQAIARSLADTQAFAERMGVRCQCLEEQSAAAHRYIMTAVACHTCPPCLGTLSGHSESVCASSPVRPAVKQMLLPGTHNVPGKPYNEAICQS